jgi:hypothetical protein
MYILATVIALLKLQVMYHWHIASPYCVFWQVLHWISYITDVLSDTFVLFDIDSMIYIYRKMRSLKGAILEQEKKSEVELAT